MAKKYYWLKLHKDFFKRHEIRIIESMDNGKDYILFYLKLLLESVSHEGMLRFSELIPYNEQMLSSITNTNVDVVRSAMKIFQDLNMIEVLDDETIFMAEVQEMIGSCTSDEGYRENHRLRQQRYRERQKQLGVTQGDVTVTQNGDVEIRDKSIEIRDKNNNIVRHQYGEYLNVLLSNEDLEKLTKEFPDDWKRRVDDLSNYMKSTGKSYKDHLATIRNWARRDAKQDTRKDAKAKKGSMHDIEQRDDAYDFAEIERLKGI